MHRAAAASAEAERSPDVPAPSDDALRLASLAAQDLSASTAASAALAPTTASKDFSAGAAERCRREVAASLATLGAELCVRRAEAIASAAAGCAVRRVESERSGG